MQYKIISKTYHRNGSSGKPFWLVEFVDPDIGNLFAISGDGFFLVVNPADATDTMRGVYYEEFIRKYIKESNAI